ncbi:hypothetical protein BH10BDE1_BH10BDE1_29220 [soil metagenome]
MAIVSLLIAGSVSSVAVAGDEDELLNILGAPGPGAAKAKDGESLLAKSIKSSQGKITAEQNIFLQFFDKGEFDKALYQWPAAFDESAFAKTPSGKALNALVLFKNGIQVSSLEMLLSIEDPKKIDEYILQKWREVAPDNAPVWASINTATWNKAWTDVFGIGAEVRVRGRQVYTADQAELVKELIKKTQIDTRERAWLSWQLVIALAQGEDAGLAGKALAVLMKAPNNPVSQDLMTMTAARLLFQNGFLDAATKYYSRIGKSSDYWFDAQEEIAWAQIRKGEPQNAIALTKTLVAPAFASQVGPEAFFLRSLSQLKVCDYPAVVATLNEFRERFKPRATELKKLAESANTPVVARLIDRLKKGPAKLTDLGKDAALLPRFVTRDSTLLQNVLTEKALEGEAKLAGELYARSLSGGTAQVGFQARLEGFKKAVDSRAQAARSATYGRVKSLADEELIEISGMLQKLHIVEAELIQQISVADRVISATQGRAAQQKTGTTGGQARDKVWFPVEGETWFDEYSNYKVDIKKGCAAAGKSASIVK